MPTPKRSLLKAPEPTKTYFDPFHSTSTGHQHDKSTLAGSKAWRESRTHKLVNQLKDSSGRGGTEHLLDLVGAGSENFRKDGRKDNGHWEKGAPGLREAGWQDIRSLIHNPRKRSLLDAASEHTPKRGKTTPPAAEDYEQLSNTSQLAVAHRGSEAVPVPTANSLVAEGKTQVSPERLPQIFRGLTMYVNGLTAPVVSDHKLKNLIVSHGGNISLNMARKSVTHAILGETGLASEKIQKEAWNVSGGSIKYVTAEWVIDSVKAGKRKYEGPYVRQDIGVGGRRQKTVSDIFSTPKKVR